MQREIIINNTSGINDYDSGILFGVSYILDHTKYCGMSIDVLEVRGHEVDTTNMVIGYVTIMALCNGFNLEFKSMPSFNRELKLFEFP